MTNRKKPALRVVMSLHIPREQHTKYTKSARMSGESLAAFIRKAADDRAAAVLAEPEKKAA